MQEKTKLLIAPCSYKAAKYAVMNWHYSRRMPKSKIYKLGVWEDEEFIGSVMFGVGATSALVRPYGLRQEQGCELVRVALSKHHTPTSQIVGFSIKNLKKNNPKLRIIVSFADTNQEHLGIIYQAGNWSYTGKSAGCYFYKDKKGKIWHPRNVSEDLWRAGKCIRPSVCKKIWMEGKHRYLYPLDKTMRKQIEPLRKPYPKRPTGEKVSRPANQPEVGGAVPTVGL